jgi:lipid-A-disaccharide synthase
LANALLPVIANTPERCRQIEAFGRLDAIMEIGRVVPSDRAAAAVLECAGHVNHTDRETVALPSITA